MRINHDTNPNKPYRKAVTFCHPKPVDDIAACQRLYSELNNRVAPSPSEICAMAVATLKEVLNRQKIRVQNPVAQAQQ